MCTTTEGALWCGDASATTTTTTTSTTTTATTTAPAVESCVLRFAESAMFGASPEVCKETCKILPEGDWPCSSDGPCDCPSSILLLSKSRRTQLRGHVSKHLMAGVGFIQESTLGAKVDTDMHEESEDESASVICVQ